MSNEEAHITSITVDVPHEDILVFLEQYVPFLAEPRVDSVSMVRTCHQDNGKEADFVRFTVR